MIARIIGIALLAGDAYWVYRLGFSDAFSSFGTAVVIVIVAIIGFFLLVKG